MKDPYLVLGVARTATADEIKQTYRKLARELHPDVNPGSAKAEERFKDISAAYDFLSDPLRRAQYDRGEIDATGAEKRRSWRSHAGANAGADAGFGQRSWRSGFHFGENPDDILAELLRRKEKGKRGTSEHGTKGHTGKGHTRKAQDSRHEVDVTFIEAAQGCTRRVVLVTGKELDVRIPAGATDGQSLRLKGQGYPGGAEETSGDAWVDIKVAPHPVFSRRELNVLADIPVSLQEAVLGGKITVPTIDGAVSLSVPPGSNTGTVLRLKGKGLTGAQGRGDQLVTLKVVLPENDDELRKFVEKWGPRNGYDPRAKIGIG